ncbi:MAG: GGDEF domain-containing protein, partial [Lachnospiraceae bacterium]|nr:GGDEF domain-containing protein [Lachnospiraceae bacterium]
FTLLLLLRYFYHSVNDVMTFAGNARLTQLAYTDALTKLPNRAYCEIALDNLFREDRSFAVVSMDVNDLKKINDRDGHAAGDELLKNFADSLRTSFRSTDICGRMSGDEFIAILYDVTPLEYEEKVRQVLTELPVSISFGAAHCDEVSARDAHAVYKLADERMYLMKQQIHEQEAAYANT